jgi:signal transduction histidine kinase
VQIQQVMVNLIVNAIQAMSGDGDSRRELLISTETDAAEGVRVGVRDTGPGLAPESLLRLFEPFYTTKAEGMGMGLAIRRSIVEAHGGRLWATACEPHGTLFQFTIRAVLDDGFPIRTATLGQLPATCDKGRVGADTRRVDSGWIGARVAVSSAWQ